MNAVWVYLVKSSLSVLVLYGCYWLFLRKDTFFQMNRFYLIAMILFSMLMPLIPINWTPSATTTGLLVLLDPVWITPGAVVEKSSEGLRLTDILWIVYFTGVAIFLLRFLVQLVQLYRITRKFGVKSYEGKRVVFVDKGYSPFSFFNIIYINEDRIEEKTLPTVLEHESIHIRQKHTLDLILLELVLSVQWFNPAVWLTGREMKTIHEYLADEGVLKEGAIGRSQYQLMILDESMGIQVNGLTNNFNVSLLKRRITMMTKTKSGKWAMAKLLFMIPALAGLLFLLPAYTLEKLPAAPVSIGATDNSSATAAGAVTKPGPSPQEPKTDSKYYTAQPKPTANEKEPVYDRVDEQPEYKGGMQAMSSFLVSNMKYPEDALKKGVQGTVFVTFVVQKNGSVTNVKILRGIGSGCDEEAMRVVKMMPNWNPGKMKGKAVAVQFNLPIKFKLNTEKKDSIK